MGADGRRDGQGVGEYREAGAEHHLGRRKGQGKPVVRADAVVTVFSRHREAQFVSVRQGAYR
jgi:hypothetical protein